MLKLLGHNVTNKRRNNAVNNLESDSKLRITTEINPENYIKKKELKKLLFIYLFIVENGVYSCVYIIEMY